MSRAVALAFLLSLLSLAWPGVEGRALAQQAVHRCIDASGATIFSDRACADLQAQNAPASAAPGHGGATVAVRGCARTRGELLAGVRAALAAQDVNRLANFYLWTGMGTREAYGVMDELGRVAAHPLVDARLEADPDAPAAATTATPPALAAPTSANPVAAAAPRAARLRVDQGTSATDPGARISYFRLENQAGCWWITF